MRSPRDSCRLLAAPGAIGTLGEGSSFAQRERDAENGASHTDRYMALKALGDLVSNKALTYLRERQRTLPDTAEGVAQRENMRLYLDDWPAPAIAARSLDPS